MGDEAGIWAWGANLGRLLLDLRCLEEPALLSSQLGLLKEMLA